MSGNTRAEESRTLSRRALVRAGGCAVAGAGLAAAGGTAAAQSGPDYGNWFNDVSNFDGTVDRTGQSEVTVEVGADGNGGTFAFAPAAVRVDPGTTVVFEWVSNSHNVLPESQPEGAGWEGHSPIENQGFSYEHTFETEGLYKYYCQPHLSLGMKGAIVVGGGGGGGGGGGEGGGGGGEGAGEGGGPPAGTGPLLIGVGSVLGTAFLAVLAIGLYVLFGDGSYEPQYQPESRRAAPAAARGLPRAQESRPASVAREIGHDDYDPFGTASLVVAYFVILILMWLFMYFVEFLGSGPTVVG
ncbi:MAG: halocyanin domain-containing protein [Haloferacaceae archaeon]